MKYECANCAAEWDLDELAEIRDPEKRRPAMYEPDAAGECPSCGALCFQGEPSDAQIEAQRDAVPFEQTDSYRDSMRDAGRGHLLRD